MAVGVRFDHHHLHTQSQTFLGLLFRLSLGKCWVHVTLNLIVRRGSACVNVSIVLFLPPPRTKQTDNVIAMRIGIERKDGKKREKDLVVYASTCVSFPSFFSFLFFSFLRLIVWPIVCVRCANGASYVLGWIFVLFSSSSSLVWCSDDGRKSTKVN